MYVHAWGWVSGYVHTKIQERFLLVQSGIQDERDELGEEM